MIIYKEILSLQNKLHYVRNNGKKIGFVPTMGALHKGHLSLIEKGASTNDIMIVSIFINPTQFNDKKDFQKYPIALENDIYLLQKGNTEILFLPSIEQMYPEGLVAQSSYDLGYLERILEGLYRPGHFQGVCRIVHKLLNIIQPGDLFMGQKDYQQCLIIKKIIEAYNIPAHLHIVPTQREENGLALSSRNLRLSAEAKQKASAIFKVLNFIKDTISNTPIIKIKEEAFSMIMNAGFEKIDYIEICDATTLIPITDYNNKTKSIALTAAFIEGIRLIDNLLLD